MSIISKWRDFSYWLYEKVGKKIQPTYNDIKSWKTPDWVKQLAEQVWSFLDEEKKKFFYEFVMKTLKSFDEEFAKDLIDKVLGWLLQWTRNDNN